MSHQRSPSLQSLQVWEGSEATPSESLVTSDDELVRAKPPTAGGSDSGGGVQPGELSGSSLHSTPPLPPSTQADGTPFATDNLGDTVVRLDKVCGVVYQKCL